MMKIGKSVFEEIKALYQEHYSYCESNVREWLKIAVESGNKRSFNYGIATARNKVDLFTATIGDDGANKCKTKIKALNSMINSREKRMNSVIEEGRVFS